MTTGAKVPLDEDSRFGLIAGLPTLVSLRFADNILSTCHGCGKCRILLHAGFFVILAHNLFKGPQLISCLDLILEMDFALMVVAFS